jgi:ankyrin repeat protein
VDKDAFDWEYNTAMLLAAGGGRDEAVEWLVTVAGSNKNWVNKSKHTALHRAACWGRGEVMAILKKQGAQTHLRNSQGKT